MKVTQERPFGHFVTALEARRPPLKEALRAVGPELTYTLDHVSTGISTGPQPGPSQEAVSLPRSPFIPEL